MPIGSPKYLLARLASLVLSPLKWHEILTEATNHLPKVVVMLIPAEDTIHPAAKVTLFMEEPVVLPHDHHDQTLLVFY